MEQKHLIKGFAIAAHVTGYIIGPLLLIGGLGLFLDRYFDTYPFILIAGLIVAFITTNVLIYKKASGMLDQYAEKPPQESSETGKQE